MGGLCFGLVSFGPHMSMSSRSFWVVPGGWDRCCEIRSHGAIFGIVLFSGMIGGAIGPLLTGRFFDVTGSYLMAFIRVNQI